MHIDFRALLFLLSFCVASVASADTLSVDDLLDNSDPAAALDDLENSERQQMVTKLSEELDNANKARKSNIANTLCKSRAWTSAGDDDEVQRKIWAQMAELSDPQSDLSYLLDCAAVNRSGFYRAATLTPLFNMRVAYCAGQPLGEDVLEELNGIESQMAEFSSEVATGLTKAFQAADKNPTTESFFPLRTEFRLAVVRAARAVQLAKDGDWPAAQAEFTRLSNNVPVYEPEDYKRTWGAWRYHNDLVFYRNFYTWLGGAEDLGMAELVTWPVVTEDEDIKAAIPSDLAERIEAQNQERTENGHTTKPYVDWIFVERLLPGAAPDAEECGSWRRRFYDTRALAKQVNICANKYGQLTDYASLQIFDQCVHEFQAEDWSVQYMTIKIEHINEAQLVISKFIDRLLDKLSHSELEFDANELSEAEQVLRSFKPYRVVGSNATVLMLTNSGLSTDMRNALEEIIASEEVPLPWGATPLFRRPSHF